MTEITQEQVREMFEYRDGNLYWRVAKRPQAKVGDLAGNLQKNGYRRITIDGKHYYAHRLIFLYHNGYIPEGIDHIDGDPLNNNVSNLRPATQSQNCMNKKKIKEMNGKSVSSDFKGVCWCKRDKKWSAQIQIDGKQNHLGYFASEVEAARAYDVAALERDAVFANCNFKSSARWSENSACTWHLGITIIDPGDVAAFEENMANAVLTPEMKRMADYLKTRPDMIHIV